MWIKVRTLRRTSPATRSSSRSENTRLPSDGRERIREWAPLVALGVGCSGALFAQDTRARVQGIVTDATQAVVALTLDTKMTNSPSVMNMIPASRRQPLYLAESACFRSSDGKLSCLTCHDPHSGKATAGCNSCHGPVKHQAATRIAGRACVECHMPKGWPSAASRSARLEAHAATRVWRGSSVCSRTLKARQRRRDHFSFAGRVFNTCRASAIWLSS